MSNSRVNIDEPNTYPVLDPDNMYRKVTDLVHQMQDAWNLAGDISLPDSYRSVRSILLTGMGGSAIGGSLLEAYGGGEIPVPFVVWRNYGVPGWVNQDTLVIAASYSGNTEETISALEAAKQRGAKVLGVTTGGRVKELVQQWEVPLLTFSYVAQPRATLGYLFTPLVRIFARLGFLPEQDAGFEEALSVVERVSDSYSAERPTDDNRAKQLARAAHNRMVVIYGGDYLSAVARRWKTQMNENAKNWAFYEEFSELNHNAIVGYEFPAAAVDQIEVVVLHGSHLPDRIQLRMQVTQELMERADVRYETVEAEGSGKLAQMFSLIALGDYASYYLALLNGADPTEIRSIDYLKNALSGAS